MPIWLCIRTLVIAKQQPAFQQMLVFKLCIGIVGGHTTQILKKHLFDLRLVILPDGRKYVLVILSKNVKDDSATKEMMAGVSRMIYDYLN